MRERFSWSSSKGSRNTQRAALVAEAIASAPSQSHLDLPARLAQLLGHGHAAFFRQGMHPSERVSHALQALLSGTVLGLEIAILVKGEECSPQFELLTELCKASYICKLLYLGVVVPAEVVSEVSKDPYEPEPVLPLHNNPPEPDHDPSAAEESDEEHSSDQASGIVMT